MTDGAWTIKSGVTHDHISIVDGDPIVTDSENRIVFDYKDGRKRIFPYISTREVVFTPKEILDK